VGKYGAYLQRGDDTARLPDDIPPDELNLDRALELLEAPNGDRELGVDPATGLPVFVRAGRFGTYVQLGKAGTGKDKPRTSSILSSMSPETLTLQDAVRLLTLPRQVGLDPESGEPITAQLGRYGPYVARGRDSRTLAGEEDVFTVNLEQALELFASPRQRRVRTASAPLAEFGVDPDSGKPITLREGRFGLYVTDGEVNASLRREDKPDALTVERARDLLRLRRERGPVKRARKSGRTATRSKKRSPKQSAKKATTRKATAKQPAQRKGTAKKKPAKQKASSKKSAGKSTGGAAGSTSRKRTTKKSEGKTGAATKPSNRSSTAGMNG
jgi:DNA topoisomerase-1